MKTKIMLMFVFGIFLISLASISAVGENNFCCEKTQASYGIGEAWCQNAPQENCNPDYGIAPTSCESTSFCRTGVCIDTAEGVCMPNSPESACVDAGGTWDERDISEIPQCQLGCCLLGDQVSFTTSTRCKQLSSVYGLESDYRNDITSEAECIATSSSDAEGACVIVKDSERDCKRTTKKECQEIGSSEKVEFYEGFLCSNEALETNCGPRGGTTCIDGKDGVYFKDTCGNIANIYDSTKKNDKVYWEKIVGRAESCGFGESNKESKDCGNCDYFAGSVCSEAKSGEVNYGKNICKSLDCEYVDSAGEKQTAKHGETWCAQSPGTSKIQAEENSPIKLTKENLPGSRYFRRVCYNGEVTTEPCADYRNEVCVSSSIPTPEGDFRTAECRTNKWNDCSSQDDKKECENGIKRDCVWIKGERYDKKLITDPNEEDKKGACVPRYSPGFNFWDGGDAQSSCGIATTECLVAYEKGIFGGEGDLTESEDCLNSCREREGCGFFEKMFERDCENSCERECTATCVNEDKTINEKWLKNRENMCYALGDCGIKVNYQKEGNPYYSKDDLLSVISGKEGKSSSESSTGTPQNPTTPEPKPTATKI